MSESENLRPGDQGVPGEAPVGENLCHVCSGSGEIDGAPCTTCDGTGLIEQGVGGA